MIEQRIQLPCAGIVPYLPDLGLDEEDSVALEEGQRARSGWKPRDESPHRPLRIGVVRFPYLANFTDFDSLAAEPSVSLAFLNSPEELPEADLLILPGSKQTLDDLRWLRHSGFATALQKFAGRAGVMGICGGMQMMGASIDDPQGAENNGVPRADPGLGLLPIDTVLHAEKVTRVAHGRVRAASLFGEPLACPGFQGYEIHLGETVYAAGAQPFAEVHRCGESASRPDGAVSDSRRAFGTYIHGLFNDDGFRHAFLSAARGACGLDPLEQKAFVHAEREQRIDRLANHVRRALDMNLIHACLGVKS
jgi:adenosylcobyric acid synthase